MTGFTYMSTDLAAKRLELLRQIYPSHSNFAALYHPAEPSTKFELEQTEAAAKTLGVKFQKLAASQPSELEKAFAALAKIREYVS